jgi:hypothetical protein
MLITMNPTPGQADLPHRFAGTLAEAHHACARGHWQISLRLDSDDGRSLYVYSQAGEGPAGALHASLTMAGLQIGQRYHGAASMHRRGDLHDYYTGRVSLQRDQRRAPTLRLVITPHHPTVPEAA